MKNQDKIFNQLKKSLASEYGGLPIFSAVSVRLQLELIKDEPDLQLIEQLIIDDQSLSSNILKLSNSSLYAGLVQIRTVKNAIIRLGMAEIMHVVCIDINNNLFSSPDKQIDDLMKKLWTHSVACAYGAALLTTMLEDEDVKREEAFSAGLFHDIGKLLILKVIETKKKFYKVLDMPEEDLLEAIAKLHAAHGHLLMERMKLPKIYPVIARDHHVKRFDTDNTLLVIVRIANLICHKLCMGIVEEPDIDVMESDEVAALNLTKPVILRVQHFLRHNQTIKELIEGPPADEEQTPISLEP
ncbi:HDOD domain-containing protein [Desulfobulbus rhabdoformis]|jgi:HD-like signal output (HDOD) protein|uniref:HDOD domain-containing protein n=1 Tax=Desulfobulbus rhabdoformis TaxID=34032 RepID=UPI00196278D6|nr:HDOD domain-containing protein [Desulfobulbus rhabdoformis]MBM9614505.1 HDOD domain-containing protein [Desulfobulbus rhabdoformis]